MGNVRDKSHVKKLAVSSVVVKVNCVKNESYSSSDNLLFFRPHMNNFLYLIIQPQEQLPTIQGTIGFTTLTIKLYSGPTVRELTSISCLMTIMRSVSQAFASNQIEMWSITRMHDIR